MEAGNISGRRLLPTGLIANANLAGCTPSTSVDYASLYSEDEALATAAMHENLHDYDTAIKIYISLADDGSDEAREQGVLMFKEERGVLHALNYCLQAHENGSLSASRILGFVYLNGYGVKQDYAQAIPFLKKAADQGVPEAWNNLAYIYFHGGHGVTRDYAKAINYFRRADKLGLPEVLNNLGVMYQNGFGVTQDYSIALTFFKKASDQGFLWASNSIESMYKNKFGVDENFYLYLDYFEKSAKMGNQAAIGILEELRPFISAHKQRGG